jgi:hypothetical protein
MVMAGEKLHVNLDAKEIDVRAEILEVAGQRALPGYSLEDGVSASGDSLD